jgi:urease accessory protein UreE
MRTQNRREELFDLAHELGIRVLNAQSGADKFEVAIHLLYPNLDALEDALQVAERDNFQMIYIHNSQTWGNS